MKKIISGLLISTMLFSAASAFAAEEKTPAACGGNIKIETSINGTTVTTSTDANGKLITTTTDGAKHVKENTKSDETDKKDETEKAESFFEKYFKDYVIKLFIAYIKENPQEVRRLLDETANPTVESAETVK